MVSNNTKYQVPCPNTVRRASTKYFLQSSAVPLKINDIDTDQIIPARYLKAVNRSDVKEGLFRDWKYNADGSLKEDFALNKAEYKDAKIIIAQHNFGCGSSREHAPWTIYDNGFRAIIAISFADIFRNNCMKNGILPITFDEKTVMQIIKLVEKNPNTEIQIDLKNQKVIVSNLGEFNFEIDPFRKTCILKNTDEIGYTLGFIDKIEGYERSMKS